MWQDWYDKYGSFAQGFPASYDHAGRTHSRPMPRSRSRSHSPRPPKRSRSPGDPSRWRRERSPKRPRLDVKDKDRPIRVKSERDEFRRSPADKARERDRRKDVHTSSKPEKDNRTHTVVAAESERTSRVPVKLERRRNDERREDAQGRGQERVENHGLSRDRAEGRDRSLERDSGRGRSREKDDFRGRSRERDNIRGRSRERDDIRGRSREKDDIRGRSHERDDIRGRSRERDINRDQRRSKVDAREDETDRAIDSARGATAKASWDKENSEPQEEASSIPVIGGGTVASRPVAATRARFDGSEREGLRERGKEEPTREVKEEPLPRESEHKKSEDQLRDPARVKQERPPEEPVWGTDKDDQSREVVDRPNKERQPVKAEVSDAVDLKPDLVRKEKPASKEPAPDSTSSTTCKAPSRGKDSSSGSDRSSRRSRSRTATLDPVPTKEKKVEKLAPKEKPVSHEVADSSRKRPDRQVVKKKTSPSAEDILIANVPGASKWESNLSDSDLDVPPPRQKGKDRDHATNLPR